MSTLLRQQLHSSLSKTLTSAERELLWLLRCAISESLDGDRITDESLASALHKRGLTLAREEISKRYSYINVWEK